MKELKVSKRYYIGLLPFEDFFYIGGVSAEEGKKHSFDNVSNLSYGIYHAYVDVIETKNGPKIERFGIENGNIKGNTDGELQQMEYTAYEQTTDLFGLFEGETIKNKVESKSCSSCSDMEMKNLMRTLLSSDIVTRVDGIEIPAKVIDNTYFIVKEELTCSPAERKCRIETNKGGKVTLFECILVDSENEADGVVDAHNGYSECVNKVKEDTDRLNCNEKECDSVIEDVAQCKYFDFSETIDVDDSYVPNTDVIDYSFDDYQVVDGHVLMEDYSVGEYVNEKCYDLQLTNEDKKRLYGADEMIKDLNEKIDQFVLSLGYVPCKSANRVIVKQSGGSNLLKITIEF